MRSVLALFLASTLAAAACGGGSSSVTAPSPLGSGSPGASAGATITGFVTAPPAPRSSVAMRPMDTGLMVQVVGTSISVAVNADGSFTLTGVPGGDIQLRFSGPGVDATCTITAVQAQERIEIKVTVSGTVAVIESQQRGNSDHASFPINGVVSDLVPAVAPATNFTFKIGSQAIYGDADTEFFGDGDKPNTVADLKNGARVEVKALRQADGSVYAVRIHINDDSGDEIKVTGRVTAIDDRKLFIVQIPGGSPQTVYTSAATIVKWRGDVVPFSMLAINQVVEVEGTPHVGGGIDATKISIEEDAEGEVEFKATISEITGTAPDLLLKLANYSAGGVDKVKTSALTVVRRRGDVQSLSALQVGQTIEVEGTLNPDGSVTAKKISIQDDEPEGLFEIEGTLGGLKGTCPALEFGVNGYSIYTTGAATTFESASACGALRNGDRVQVKGTKQADGRVLASEVKEK
jgi:hypothetical protein